MEKRAKRDESREEKSKYAEHIRRNGIKLYGDSEALARYLLQNRFIFSLNRCARDFPYRFTVLTHETKYNGEHN